MNILNTKIDEFTKDQVVSNITANLRKSKKTKISKINTEFLYRTLNDKDFQKVINASDLNIVDGRGVLWAARYLTIPISDNILFRIVQSVYQMIYSLMLMVINPNYVKSPIPEAVPGVYALKMLMEIAVREGAGVFIFGSPEKVLKKSIKKLKQEFPALKISGYLNGYDFQKDLSIDVVGEINKTDAKILIVALGSPRQEYWINENMYKLKNIVIAVGEGGTLDRIANPLQAAPNFINIVGLEWLWRLLFNKSRTGTRNRLQRFWNSVPSFIVQVVKWKVKNEQTKV